MPRVAAEKAVLTRRIVEGCAPREKRYRVSDATQRGLKLVVEPNGRKYWIARYVTFDGRESEKQLGDWPSITIEQARTDAGLIRARINRQLVDPTEEVRRTRREAEQERIAEAKARELTFTKLAAAYIEASRNGFRAPRQRHRKAPSSIYREEKVLQKHVIPCLGARAITEIKRRDIVDLVEDVAKNHGEGAANGVVAVIRRCFAYARYKDMIEHNPAIEIQQYARPPRDVVASDSQIRTLWRLLEEARKDPDQGALTERKSRHPRKDSKPTALALQFSLLTLQRRSEVSAIHKDDIDWHKALWTIPTLNKKERRLGLVPLAPMALALLQEAFADSGSDWAFRGLDSSTHIDPHSLTKFMDRLRKKTGLKKITPHDLRRTGRTKLTSDEVGVDEMTAERVLNHVVGSRQQRAYDWQQYTTQKRAALEAWERELARIIYDRELSTPTPSRATAPDVDILMKLPTTGMLH